MSAELSEYAARLDALTALVERQARAWERNEFDLAAEDWRPDGVLVAPSGEFPVAVLRATIENFHKRYSDLVVEITNLFATPDGSKAAVEWTWQVTRKRDGARSITYDAIIIDLVDGKIASWREYFDPATSVETG